MSDPAAGRPGVPQAGGVQPLLRVVRGEPTDEELAALVAVLTARPQTPPLARVRSAWSDPARRVRRRFAPGPDGWRLSQRGR